MNDPSDTQGAVPNGCKAAEDSDAKRPDELLWHYTNTQGLLGILKTQTFWATDARFLNDARELTWAQEAQRQYLALADDKPWSTIAGLFQGIAQMGLTQQSPAPPGVYVTCLSRARDQLSQWRGYSAGPGYALAFRRQSLSDAAEACGAHLKDVTYIDGPFTSLPEGIVPSQVVLGQRGAWVVTEPTELATVKHRAFREESEVRFIKVSQEKPEYRPGRWGPTPYVTLGVPLEDLVEVMVGPGNDQDLRVVALAERLTWEECDPQVSTSSAPFRA